MDYQVPNHHSVDTEAIQELAIEFSKEIGYTIGGDLRQCVINYGGMIKDLTQDSFEESGDGTIIVDGPQKFTIHLSAYTGEMRNRFTIAHELGHYVLHSQKGKIPLKAKRFGSSFSETQANRFGAELLMPEDIFRASYFEQNGSISRLASVFGVSLTAIDVRIESLNIHV